MQVELKVMGESRLKHQEFCYLFQTGTSNQNFDFNKLLYCLDELLYYHKVPVSGIVVQYNTIQYKFV